MHQQYPSHTFISCILYNFLYLIPERPPFYVKNLGSGGEYAQLGLAREENTEAWDALEQAMGEKQTVEATVVERVKGGLAVTVGELTAFLPGSQTGIRGGEDLDGSVVEARRRGQYLERDYLRPRIQPDHHGNRERFSLESKNPQPGRWRQPVPLLPGRR